MRGQIPLRCLCGNAVVRLALEHEIGAKEVVTSLCPVCDTGGGFEELFYTAPTGKLMTYAEWMEFRGLQP
jgi:hypothetical protein